MSERCRTCDRETCAWLINFAHTPRDIVTADESRAFRDCLDHVVDWRPRCLAAEQRAEAAEAERDRMMNGDACETVDESITLGGGR